MIHTFDSKRFGKITYDSSNSTLFQDGHRRDLDARSGFNEFTIYRNYHDNSKLPSSVKCRIRLDNEIGVAYLEILEYVSECMSTYNYDSFEKAAQFIKNTKHQDGGQIYIGGVKFYGYRVEDFLKKYTAAARKKITIKVHINGVYFT